MKNIRQVSDSYLCSNCGACSAVCHRNAIVFKWTNIGRLYADVTPDCVNCGKCLKVCPSIDEKNIHNRFEDRFVGEIKSVWVGRATDNLIFQNSQSGGATTAILSFLFDEGLIDAALVCKMSFGSLPQVNPFIATSKQELSESQKSCYTPVPLLTKLAELKSYKSVAVVGIPCHIQGIESLMKGSSEYNNIRYRIGLICDRSECNGIQTVIKSLTGQENFKVVWRRKYDCKSMSYDYENAPLTVVPRDGNSVVLPRLYRIGLKDMFTSPRCWVCWDKLNVFADITLGDPWRLPDVNLKEGESLVIARTDTGTHLVETMQERGCLRLRQVDNDAPLKSQLIESRRKQVEDYASAFEELSPSIDSYLLHRENSFIEPSANAKTMLRRFADNEGKTEEMIVQIAKAELTRREKERKREDSMVNRLKMFFRRIKGYVSSRISS